MNFNVNVGIHSLRNEEKDGVLTSFTGWPKSATKKI